MAELLKSDSGARHPLVDRSSDTLDLIYFDLLRVAPGGQTPLHLPHHEALLVILSGQANIHVDGRLFEAVGRREDIWSGEADSVYVPVGANVRIVASRAAEIAVAGGLCAEQFEPFRVTPEETDAVEVGSEATHSHRRIVHLLGQKQAGRCGHLLVSELYAGAGCWSGYPPHKHDTNTPGLETAHEELYHYRFQPETGFGGQFVYTVDGHSKVYMTRHGDTFLLDRGYHPTVTSPGHRSYIFTILVGHEQRGLVQRFDPEHEHLVSVIPGIQDMRNKFR